MEDVELVDDAPVTAGYRLRAIWGPSRWRVGGSVPVFANIDAFAYAPDGESVWFVRGGSFVHLDRAGRRLGGVHRVPGEVWSTTNGRRVAYTHDRRALAVLELPSMREVFRVDVVGHVPLLSADGEVVGCAPFVYRVADGAVLGRVEHLTSLSPDGTHALSARLANHVAEVALHRVGGDVVAQERSHHGLGWHVAWSADGEHVAWSRRDDVALWNVRDPARRAVLERVAGKIRWIDTPVGARLLAQDLSPRRQGPYPMMLLAPDGSRAPFVGGSCAVYAVTPRGDRALALRGGVEVGELDLNTGTWLDGASATAPAVTRVAWAPRGDAALVLRMDGDLRLWDVAGWRTMRVIDPERAHVRRSWGPGAAAHPLIGVEHVTMAFSRDGARLVFVDGAATVTAMTREGEPLWTRTLAPPSSGRSDWHWNTGHATDEGETICVESVWTSTPVTEPDGTASSEDRRTLTRLDANDGSIRAVEELPDDDGVWAARLRPRFQRVSGATDRVYVDGEVLAIDPLLGGADGVYPSPDESMILVPTRAGLLLRFDRARA